MSSNEWKIAKNGSIKAHLLFKIVLHTQRNLKMEASVSTVKNESLNFQLN